MLTKIMKWGSIAVLLQAVFWRPSTNFQLVLEFVVCASAIAVALDAAQADEFVWAMGFIAIALLFNPVAPLALSHGTFFWLSWASVVMFLASFVALRPQPRLSLESLLPRAQGIRSL